MSFVLSLLAIASASILGYWLYLKLGTGTADATYDGIALLSSIVWILAGVFLIMGGFVVVGMVVIIIFSYIGISKGRQTERRLRSRLAG